MRPPSGGSSLAFFVQRFHFDHHFKVARSEDHALHFDQVPEPNTASGGSPNGTSSQRPSVRVG